MIEVEVNFKAGLNLDDSLYNVPQNAYVNALNITRDAVEGASDEAITNVVGNRRVPYTYPTSPSAALSISDLLPNVDNVGTITGTAGLPVTLTINLTGSDIGTRIEGTIDGTTYYVFIYNHLQTFTFIIPDSGVINYNLHFYSVGSGNSAVLSLAYINTTGTISCIGAYPNTLRNTVIYFICQTGGLSSVLEYNNTTRTISPIFTSVLDSGFIDILNFTPHDKITSVNIYPRDEGDLLFFIDSLGRPTVMDIDRMKIGEYTPVTRDILDVGKCPPLSPPSCFYANDTARRTNSLRNSLFRFKYRWVYDNNEKSTCSPISRVPYPENILSDQFTGVVTNNNLINITLNTGAKDVKSVELLMSYVNKTNIWSDFSLVSTVKKSSVLLNSKTALITEGNSTTAVTQFNGAVSVGTLIEMYVTLLPSTRTLVATYTTVVGDTLNSIALALKASMTTLFPSVVFMYVYGNTFYWVFSSGTAPIKYAFDDVEITPIDPEANNLDFIFGFYNDSTYPVIPINESIQFFDYVPDLANAQELPNGNVLMYGGITEGYDRDLIPNVSNEIKTYLSSAGTGSLNAVITPEIDLQYKVNTITFSGVPLAGTLIVVRLTTGTTTIGFYTTLPNDGLQQITAGLAASMAAIRKTVFVSVSGASMTVKTALSFGDMLPISISPPSVVIADAQSIPTFANSTSRQIGIAYFDKKGKTNGILYNDTLVFPAYAESGDNAYLPYVNTKIYHAPPAWAYSYNFYMTKDPIWYLFWGSTNVIRDTNNADIFFDVSNFVFNAKYNQTTAEVLSYNFQDGDRLRLIKGFGGGTLFDDTYDAAIEGLVVDPIISTTARTGSFLKIKAFNPLNTVTYGGAYLIQIYRPAQQSPNSENAVFYEYGAQYAIGDPTLSTRYHTGQVTDQITATGVPAEFNFYDGDSFYRKRTTKSTEVGYITYSAFDRNFVDSYPSAVSSIDGRPNVIDINAKRAYYSTLTRFGQAYQANTNINGFNRFYPNNFDEYDYSYGDIKRFKVRDRFVRVFQKFKVGQVPLYSQILKEQNKESLVVTDRLLNPIQYYNGDLGIGDNAESLASYSFADYFTSNIKGVVGRVSNDGVTFLSIDHKVNSWATENLPPRTGNLKVYGVFDQRQGNYIAALEGSNDYLPETIVFDEKNKSFESFISLYPEMMTTLGVLLIAFKAGELWTHDGTVYNNFFGVQYDSYVGMVFNKNPMDKKSFKAITEVASEVWEAPIIQSDVNSVGTSKQETNLVASDFAEVEGSFHASLLRDSLSIGGLIDGDSMKGKYLNVLFKKTAPANLVALNIVSLCYINSPLNKR